MDEDEYEFTSSIETGSGSEAEAFNKTAKKQLANKLRPIFQAFPKAMIETHGKDLLADAAAADSNGGSGASTPASTKAKSTPTVPSVSGLSIGNKTKETVSEIFACLLIVPLTPSKAVVIVYQHCRGQSQWRICFRCRWPVRLLDPA